MRGWSPGALPAGLSRPQLVEEVRGALDEPVARDTAILLAVSGGPDSVALAHLAVEARPDLRATVAHVRHGLRDDRADAETAAAHAQALGLAYEEERAQVVRAGHGLEAAARHARYEALGRIARRAGTDTVLVGHTADDQAETVLLNLVRGSGLGGLAAMAPVRTLGELRVVRPLLRIRRADVRGFVSGEGMAVVEDPTNADPVQRRAQARHHVLPTLGALGGDPVGALTRMADLARADAEALDAVAAAHASRLVTAWGPARVLPVPALRSLPEAVASRVVRLALGRVRGGLEGLSGAAVARALGLETGRETVVGGVRLTSGGGWLAALPVQAEALAERALAVPGRTPLPEAQLVMEADEPALPAPPDLPLAPAPPGGSGPMWALLPAEGRPFVVRARRPGDRIRLGVGTRKVQDVFVDAGVPRALRDLVPLVVNDEGEVCWVVGVRAALLQGPAGPRAWVLPG